MSPIGHRARVRCDISWPLALEEARRAALCIPSKLTGSARTQASGPEQTTLGLQPRRMRPLDVRIEPAHLGLFRILATETS